MKSFMKKAITALSCASLAITMFAAPAAVSTKPEEADFALVQVLEASAATYSTGTYTVNSSIGVNVRRGAGTGNSIVGAATNKTQFTVTKISNGWGYTSSIKCTNGTKAGWVYLENCVYKAPTSGTTVKNVNYKVVINTAAGLNVRQSYSTGSAKLTAIPYNKTVTVTQESSNNWGKVTYGGKTGWISLDYTKKAASSSSSGTSSGKTSKVSLKVTSFKQGDSRWKNIKIGRATIGGVGCTVTSLAMLYSYKTGTTVTPKSIVSKLSFTNSGAVYWNGVSKLGFTWTCYDGKTINQSIMQTIYNKLKAGKPVMIGCTNSKGDEHWVTITGYNGSTSTFSASGFTINDPGYNRTNLQQHLNYVNKVQRIVY